MADDKKPVIQRYDNGQWRRATEDELREFAEETCLSEYLIKSAQPARATTPEWVC